MVKREEKQKQKKKKEEEEGEGQKGKETVLFCCVLSCSVFAVAAIVCILCFLFCLSICLVWFGLVWFGCFYVCLFVFLSLSLYFLLPRVLISMFFLFFFLYKEQSGQKIVIIRRCQNMPPFDVLLNNLHRRPVVWLFVCSFFLFPSFSVFLFFFFFFFFFFGI
ncbi:uncharacterized protein PWA37_005105 [Arxiozyma heterogenica]|uniref:uncharacterized protein n=1 Tax=Arxiozyma heterogenica TaxID=278026 RepID=UPI002F1B524E